MSHLLDQLRFFNRKQNEFSDGHGETRKESRDWENVYRSRWQYDKIVRSTHGVNCTGSCSWKIYVKNGLITWETQQTDYPRTRNDLPNHEPRGCPRGASYSWYIYSANRLKYPKIRKPLLKLWRDARQTMAPVEAWASIVEDKRAGHQVRLTSATDRCQPQHGRPDEPIAGIYKIKSHGSESFARAPKGARLAH